MENTNQTEQATTAEHNKASVALGVIMAETIVHKQKVEETANKVADVLEKEFGGVTLTLLAALFSLAIEHAGDYLTPELIAQATALD